MSGKWGHSTDEENYTGGCETREEAIAEGSGYGGTYWVGRAIPPTQPEDMIDAADIVERIGEDHEDWSFDFCDWHPTREQIDELTAEWRKSMAAWLDRHNLRPSWFVIDPTTVEEIGDVGSDSA